MLPAGLALALVSTAPAATGPATLDAARAVTLEVGARATERRRYVVAAMGDSLTDVRAGGGLYLRDLAERCPGSTFDAYGVGGQRTDHMRWRFDDVLDPARGYTHVIVLGGINDLAAAPIRSASTERIQRNLARMYSRASEHGLKVIALTLPPWMSPTAGRDARRGATANLNSWIVEQQASGDVSRAVTIGPALDCDGVLCERYRRFRADVVHWNAAGHAQVAQLLADQVFFDCE